MSKQKLNVQGLTITIEQVKKDDYISLTDIAKKSDSRADILIASWMKPAIGWTQCLGKSRSGISSIGMRSRYSQSLQRGADGDGDARTEKGGLGEED